MKKLLVLVLVLGISSVASAVGTIDLVISSYGPDLPTQPIDPVKDITIAPSEWVNLDIILPGSAGAQSTAEPAFGDADAGRYGDS